MDIKRNYRTILFIITVFPLMAFSCGDKVEGGHRYITFINKSEQLIYVGEKWQIKISPDDTTYECNSRQIEILARDTSNSFEPLNNFWETDFEAIPFIQFFVYPKRTSFWDSCEEAQKYQLRRYQLTKEDLDNMNWTVTYP